MKTTKTTKGILIQKWITFKELYGKKKKKGTNCIVIIWGESFITWPEILLSVRRKPSFTYCFALSSLAQKIHPDGQKITIPTLGIMFIV